MNISVPNIEIGKAVNEWAIVGCLLGTAIGDALGLSCEGLTRGRQARLFPNISHYHFLFGRGMVSDDTEHTCMVAKALLISAADTGRFQKSLAWQLRWWLLGLPAGIGSATLRAILRLWMGSDGTQSGVYSAGNGPAMRSAILGVCYGHDLDKLRMLVRVSTRLTHTDPKAEYGAYAIALAAAMASTGEAISPVHYVQALETHLGTASAELLALIRKAVQSAERDESTADFADMLGLQKGVSGYVYHTVPIVIQCWLRHQNDFGAGLLEIIRCGGDTDTTAAILGGIIGARVGRAGIPAEWRDGLWEWPYSVKWMEELGSRLEKSVNGETSQAALPLFAPAILLRNLVFTLTVLTHGFRRLLPPY